MVRVILGGGPLAGAGDAANAARQVREEGREAERREAEFQQNLRLAALQVQQAEGQLAAESDPNSYLNQGRQLDLDRQRAGIDRETAAAGRENALAERYRSGLGPGGGGGGARGQAAQAQPSSLQAIDRESPLVQFLGRTQGPRAVEEYARLSPKDRAKLEEDVIRPAFEREDIGKRVNQLIQYEQDNAAVAVDAGFPGVESLVAQYESGAIDHQGFVQAQEEFKIAVRENARVVAFGQGEMQVIQEFLNSPGLAAGTAVEEGAEARALAGELEVLLRDPTPDGEEVMDVVRRFHRAAAHPSLKESLDAAEAEVQQVKEERDLLVQEGLARARQDPEGTFPQFADYMAPDAAGEFSQAAVSPGTTAFDEQERKKLEDTAVYPDKLDDRQKASVVAQLKEWVSTEENRLRGYSQEQFNDSLRDQALRLGLKARPQDIEELIAEVEKANAPKPAAHPYAGGIL